MDQKTRDYMDTRVTKFDTLKDEKEGLEKLIASLTDETKNDKVARIVTQCRENRILEGHGRDIITESVIDGCRKRIGEIERLMEEI